MLLDVSTINASLNEKALKSCLLLSLAKQPLYRNAKLDHFTFIQFFLDLSMAKLEAGLSPEGVDDEGV